MALPTEQDIRRKYHTLPEPIREILNSPEYSDEVREINRKHGLDEGDSRVLTASVGLVFLGFIKPRELFREINEYLEADEKVVVETIREINRQIFNPFHKELENLHKLETHIESELDEALKKQTPAIEKGVEVPPKKEMAVPPSQATGVRPPITVAEQPPAGEPLIIHKEEGAPVPVRAEKPLKGLEPPFGFFGKEGAPVPEEPVKARIEGQGLMGGLTKPLFKGEEKRVVHYSELRTPLAPFQKPEEIINLETFGQKPQEVKAPMPAPKGPFQGAASAKIETPKPAEPPKTTVPETKPQPKIEGNVVDLR